jgi:hypothetical protein
VNFPAALDIVRLTELYQSAHQEIVKKAEQRKHRNKKHVKKETYSIGTLILLKAHRISSIDNQEVKKFFPLYEGPYLVKCSIGIIKLDLFLVNRQADNTCKVATIIYNYYQNLPCAKMNLNTKSNTK